MNLEEFVPIIVDCYSGYRADEYPICFYWNDQRYEIKEILDRWYQEDLNPEWPASDYFKIVATAGEKCILKHVLEKDAWFIIQETGPEKNHH